MKYIELFAGCGGLSLGLKANGFKLVFANELGEMAARTYASNLLENADEKFILLNSINKFHNIKLGSIFVGNIDILMEKVYSNKVDPKFLKADLISGGPPCQGFSMAGLRKEGVLKNKLPFYFLDLVEVISPKAVLIENVVGILHPFKNSGANIKTYKEIQKRLSQLGYYSTCVKIKAETFGVAEHRPRVLFLAFKKEVFESKKRYFSKYNKFYYPPYKEESCEPQDYLDLTHDDLNFINGFFKTNLSQKQITVREAIDDLTSTEKK